MSRYLLAVAIIGSLAGSAAYATAPEVDAEGRQLIQVPYTNSPPTIDGVLSPGEWAAAASNTVDYVNLGVAGNGGPGNADDTEDISYTFYAMYDKSFLYIGVSVKDDVYIAQNYGPRLQWDWPVTWENDAVEYFFDGDLSRTLESCRTPEETATGGQWIYSLGADDTALPFVAPEIFGGYTCPYGPTANDVWYAKTTVDERTADWSQEARFALSILGNPSAGKEIGFDINVDDVDVFDEQTLEPEFYQEYRDVQLYWTILGYGAGEIATENTHEIEDLWGTMRFLQPVSVEHWEIH